MSAENRILDMSKYITPEEDGRFLEQGKIFLKATVVHPFEFCLDLHELSHCARLPLLRSGSLNLTKHQRKLTDGTDAINARFGQNEPISVEDLTKETS
jgi:hypothetical protein